MVSEHLARCIAKVSGDGYLYYRYIRYNNTCTVLIDEFEKDITNEFGNVCFTRGVTNTGTPFTQIHGKRIISEFLRHLPDYHSNKIFIPDAILNSSRIVIRQYLRAFFDDEGSASLRIFRKTHEWKRSITLSSNSSKILAQVRSILLSYGIKCAEARRTRPSSSRDKSYYFGITGKRNFEIFREKVGFKHPIKKVRLDLMIKSYGNTYSRNYNGFLKIKKKLDLMFP